jgi:hypothetical protein
MKEKNVKAIPFLMKDSCDVILSVYRGIHIYANKTPQTTKTN